MFLPRHHGFGCDGSEDCQYKQCSCPDITDFAVMGVRIVSTVFLPRHHGICCDGSEDCQYKECSCPGITDFAVMRVRIVSTKSVLAQASRNLL